MSKNLGMSGTSASSNPRNYLALLKLLSVHDAVLHSHLKAPAMWCARYTSPQTQIELIEAMGKHMILQGILDDLNAATYYSVLADERTAPNVEHHAICARFVDKNNNIVEVFVSFLALERITGERM